MRAFLLFIFLFPILCSGTPLRRDPAFAVPAKLSPRVSFWVDIFSKYGEYQAIIHHRTFPQVRFEVLDFSNDAKRLSKKALDRYRAKVFNQRKAVINKALKHLGAGRSPRNELERKVQKEMSVLGSGRSKYTKYIKGGIVRSQRGIKEKYKEAIIRSGRYMHILEEVFVKEFGLPVELTRLPFVESSFNYKAYSSVGAAGIWQFMPATAKAYKMKVGRVVDERRDIVSATRGAAQYLRNANKTLGTWPLALTSYNHGVGGVSKKVRKLGTRNIATILETKNKQLFGFASQNFYPEFLAALEIYEDINRYFPGVRPAAPVYLAGKKLKNSASIFAIQKKLGVSISSLKEVNYALSDRVWSGRYNVPAGYVLKVPQVHRNKLASLVLPKGQSQTQAAASSVYGGVVYRVRRGDTLSRIAKKYQTSITKLKGYNNLRSDALRIGQTLIVRPQKRYSKTPEKLPSTNSYRIKSGDSLYAIAKRFGVTASAIRKLNGLKSSRIYVGQILILRSGATAPKAAKKSYSGKLYYKARSGDSLWSISKRHRISVSTIRNLNSFKGNKIKVGQKIRVQ